jgi:ATP-dependent Clp endopeptidase proteolytic subunit ClpP
MLLNKHIGYDETDGMGIDGALFQNELMLLDGMGKKRIQVWINSPGGVVMDGYNIYNAILKSKTKVDTYCVGIAASIAAVIFQAGRNRVMADYGKLMYHNPFGGNASELEPMRDSIAVMVASRVAKDKEEVLSIMRKTTWIGAGEAFANGFCDEIEVSANHNKKRLSGEPKAMWKAGNAILNSILNDKPLKMKKVCNKLGLNEDASEDSILAGIAEIQNSANMAAVKAKASLDEMENTLKAKAKELEDMTNSYNAMKKEKDEADAKAVETEKAAAKEKCQNMLKTFVAQGRIKSDAVNKWAETAEKIGVDEVENMLKDLPMSKTAAKVEISNVSNESQLTNVAASAMAAAREKFKI